MKIFLNRFFRAVKLDVSLFQEIIEDPKTFNQALIVVLIYSMMSAWGTFGRAGAVGNNIGMITTLLGWYVWAFSTYMVGARMLPEAGTEPDRKTILRVIGFACAPGIVRILGFIQGFGLIVILIAFIWMVAAATIGVKQAMNYESTARALGVCIIGLLISIIFQLIMFVILFQAFPVSS
ncbi:MAG: YIP1 family protein [Desulfobacterales bacterium]|nr:YIP1 family protein [Desulfobacterales bacterium]